MFALCWSCVKSQPHFYSGHEAQVWAILTFCSGDCRRALRPKYFDTWGFGNELQHMNNLLFLCSGIYIPCVYIDNCTWSLISFSIRWILAHNGTVTLKQTGGFKIAHAGLVRAGHKAMRLHTQCARAKCFPALLRSFSFTPTSSGHDPVTHAS